MVNNGQLMVSRGDIITITVTTAITIVITNIMTIIRMFNLCISTSRILISWYDDLDKVRGW